MILSPFTKKKSSDASNAKLTNLYDSLPIFSLLSPIKKDSCPSSFLGLIPSPMLWIPPSLLITSIFNIFFTSYLLNNNKKTCLALIFLSSYCSLSLISQPLTSKELFILALLSPVDLKGSQLEVILPYQTFPRDIW